MSTEDGRATIVFNGEIYNHPLLKASLEAQGERFRTRSDTETILRLYAREGRSALRRLEGMFALAVFDSGDGRAVLARDLFGVKPLYYHCDGRTLSFASELRALAALLPEIRLDASAVLDYLSYGIVHAPRTILKGAFKLPPGCLLSFGPGGLEIERFQELEAEASAGAASLGEAASEIEARLRASVRGQLLSDVPVGAFLSGGVDSSLLTALMVQESGRRVQTFSIGFSGARAGLDESAHARAVARSLGTEHHELVLPAGVLDGAGELARCLDEPIADSAILPTHLLSRFARERVKVVLSGEGADELFAGYNRYKAAFLSESAERLPAWLRPAARAAARRMGRGRIFRGIPYREMRDWAKTAAHAEPPAYEHLLSPEFRESAKGLDPFSWLDAFDGPHSLAGAQAFDLKTVLCDALLMKVDKASMAASLEARVPFLDRRLAAYALGLPGSLKLRLLKGKFVLRRLAARHVPWGIAMRRKHGFIVPWEEWVRSPGNSRLDEMLRAREFQALGIFDARRLRELLSNLRAGSEGDPGIFYRVAVLWLWYEALLGL
jgi:asparagine synthase (glutamine-hydrolysing)